MMEKYTIGQLAEKAEISAVTIRYYEKEGLLLEAKRSMGGYRLFTSDSLQRLIFINNAKTAGFSLKEINDLIQLQQQKNAKKRDVKMIVQKKLQFVEQKIKALQMMKTTLQVLENSCDGEGNLSECPILEKLHSDLNSDIS